MLACASVIWPVPAGRPVWDRFGLWAALAVILIVAAYGWPLWDLITMERFGSPGFKFF